MIKLTLFIGGVITTGLFWINPEKFMPIAGPVISHLKRKFPKFEYEGEEGAKAWDKIFKGMKWKEYEKVLNFLNNEKNHLNGKKSFKELSLESTVVKLWKLLQIFQK